MPLPPYSELLRRHVVDFPRLPWPLDLDALFGAPGELTLEIGFGNGSFLESQAKRHPERRHLGVEIAVPSAKHLLRRIERSGLENVKILVADARFVLDRLLPSASVRRAWINHPDPWPKERHHGRRLVRRETLAALDGVMTAGGELRIATDHADYAAWIGAVLEDQPWFRSALDAVEVPVLPDHEATRYELKARAEGIPNHFFVWTKVTDEAPARPVEEVPTMPNVTLRGAVADLEVLAGFRPLRSVVTRRGLDVVLALERAYRQIDADSEAWLVEAMVKEGAFLQQVGILIVRSSEDRLTVKLSSFGHPRATWGVKEAVRRVAGLLRGAHPGLEVESSNVGEIERP